jgi:hypothetical protein
MDDNLHILSELVMKKIFLVVLCLFLSFFMGCDLFSPLVVEPKIPTLAYIPSPTAGASNNASALRISAIEQETLSRDLGKQEWFELWLMPVRNSGNEVVSHSNVQYLKRFLVSDEGSYAIDLSVLPSEDKSVVFIVRVTEDDNYEVVGFLSLLIEGNEQPLLVFPPRSAIQGNVQFGTVTVTDDSYIATSSNTLEDNELSFASEVYASLAQQTVMQNLVLMAINTLWNTMPNGAFYAPGILLEYELNNEGTLQWHDANLWIYSNQYTKKAALYNPAGNNLNNGSFPLAYGSQSSVQWSANLCVSDLLESAQKGALWSLVEPSGNQLAAFDFSVAFVLDTQGNPIIPIADPTYTVDDTNPGYVKEIFFNWFYFDVDGTTKHTIEPDSEIAELMSEYSIYMDIGYPQGGLRGTYMVRDRFPQYPGAYGMKGDLFSVYDFDAPLPVDALSSIYHLGYAFTLYKCNTMMKARLSD